MLQPEEQIALAAKLLKVTIEVVQENCGFIGLNKALYYCNSVKGGDALMVGQDGTVLFADSSVGYNKHLYEFQQGRRTPLEAFA
ncbi:MAG TPA: hypothetical protein DDZ89_21800 [Clostridiales bacterium]|nr:hypothetical protein [Clostridiales bacterium]